MPNFDTYMPITERAFNAVSDQSPTGILKSDSQRFFYIMDYKRATTDGERGIKPEVRFRADDGPEVVFELQELDAVAPSDGSEELKYYRWDELITGELRTMVKSFAFGTEFVDEELR